MQRKKFILIIDIFIGTIFALGIVIIIHSVCLNMPYRLAEIITEGNSTFEKVLIGIIFFISITIFIIKGIIKKSSIKEKIYAFFILIIILLILNLAIVGGLKHFFKNYQDNFDKLVNTIINDKENQQVQIFDNDFGFEYLLVSKGMWQKKDYIEKIILNKTAAENLEFITYNSGTITIKATKGNMVFRKEIFLGKTDIEKNSIIVKTDRNIKIYKKIVNGKVLITDIR